MNDQRLIVPFTADERKKIEACVQKAYYAQTDSDFLRELYIDYCDEHKLPDESYEDEQMEKRFSEQYLESYRADAKICLECLLADLENFSYSDHRKRKALLLADEVCEDDDFEGIYYRCLYDLEKRVYLLFARLVPRQPTENPNQLTLFIQEKTGEKLVEQTADVKKQRDFNYSILWFMLEVWGSYFEYYDFAIDENYHIWRYINEFIADEYSYE